MGKRGRCGKYGEIKRHERLKVEKRGPLPHAPSQVTVRRGEAPPRYGSHRLRIEIRAARRSDDDYVIRLSEQAFRVYGPYKGLVSKWLETAPTETYIACVDLTPAGFAMIGQLSATADQRGIIELLAIAVEAGNRRKGIGAALMKAVEKRAVELHAKKAILHTGTDNLAAQALFSRSGYTLCEIKQRFYPAGQDAVMMSKTFQKEY
jgi:ribosomal-protein-alanine N-acetyltransferase